MAHTSAEIREEFQDYLDTGEPWTQSVRARFKALENCTDTVPAGYCSTLGLPAGGTYAGAIAELDRPG